MYEVELKVPADLAAVREALADRDAVDRGSVEQVDVYLGAPHRDFGETDEALRIRRETRRGGDEPSATLTYKGPLVEAASKTREEIETAVGTADEAEALLGALGFDPVRTVEKHRERYELEGYTVTLDRVTGVGEFVEVETHAEDVEPAREGARAILTDLGLDPDEHVRTSYLAMLLDAEAAGE